jgi:RNA polymerase sigma-70 factor (ECF subfamily)
LGGLELSIERFVTTQWKVILAARDGSTEEARLALESLCRAYWYPLYVYVRRRGHGADESRDLTQAFFADLLGRDWMESIDPAKGRFRSFLLASLHHFLSHERDKARALKKGGGVAVLSLDLAETEGRFAREPAEPTTPELLFERRWGLTVMERAMERLRAESAAEHPGRFEQLQPYLTGSEPQTRYRDLGAELGMSETAVKSAVHRLRQRYGRLLREEIAGTVADPADVEDELRHLLNVIRPWQALRR